MASSTSAALEECVSTIEVFDTHEHMPTEAQWLAEDEGRLDFSQLMHYVDLDVVSAGMPADDMRKVRFTDLPEDEKWALFEPHWLNAQNTAYARAVTLAVRMFYGLDGLNRSTYREIGRLIRQTRKPGRYREVLRDKAGIRIALLDAGCTNPDRELFAPVVRLDDFLWLTGRADVAALEERQQASLTSLAALEDALGRALEAAKASGAAAIKTAQSYQRDLRYERVDRSDAVAAFERIATLETATAADTKAVSDHAFYRMIEQCTRLGLPVQIHTGMNAGNAVRLEATNPVLLTEVFLTYPEARIDLFHSGFPYWEELGVLVKTFPNIRADMCWTHIVSPAMARRALDEWLDLVPANKIFGFGGDLGSVEMAAAHLSMARSNIVQVLAAKVDSSDLTLPDAKRIAKMLLHDNASSFYGL